MSDIITWSTNPADALAAHVQARVDAMEAEIVALANSLTDQIMVWMKQNARWTDRTGAARQGLYSDVEHMAREVVSILLSHNVTIDYAWFLEYAHAGRFAILGDTIDFWTPIFLRGVAEIMRRHSG